MTGKPFDFTEANPPKATSAGDVDNVDNASSENAIKNSMLPTAESVIASK